jgi:hypothetical protein
MTQPPAATFPAHELERRRAHLLAEIRRARRRRVAPLAALVAVLVALAVSLPGQLAPTRMTLVDQALAALGRGSTIHVVLEMPNAAELLDLRTGQTRALARRAEFWTDPKLGSVYRIELGGVLTQQLAASPASWTDAANHVVGHGRIQGTPVAWIASSPSADGRAQEIAISTTTYRPLFLRTVIGGRVEPGSSARVVLAETTAPRPAVFARAATTALGNGGWTHEPNGHTGIPTTLAAARASMTPHPVVTGPRLAGLRRTWLGLPDYLLPGSSSDRGQVNGLSLYYGKLDDYGDPTYAGAFVSINEITSSRAARLMLGPGYFRVGKAVVAPARGGGPALAAQHVHGLYVIVEASSAAKAIAAARALSR